MTLPVMILINIFIVVILGLLARFLKIGQAETTKGGWNFNYTTSDLIILAVVGAIAGVVNTGMGIVWAAANSAGGPLAGAALQGAFMWAYILAYYLIRKPGAMLIVGLLETAMEALLGNPSGVATMGWGFTQGIAAEAVMALVNYGNFGWWSFLLAGAASSQFGTVWTAWLFGWDSTPEIVNQYWTAAPINLISGAIFSGLLGFWLGQMVERTGLLRTTRKENA